MKKVLYVITKSNWGGAQRYVFDLATHLPKDQFEAVVALGGTGTKGAEAGLLAAKLQEAGIRTIFVESFMRDISVVKEFAALKELHTIFKSEKPDVVHLNSSKAGGVGALAARLSGVPKIIFTVHGWPFGEQRNFLVRIMMRLASHVTGVLSHVIICICDYDMRQVRFMPGVRAVRIYNGVEANAPLGDGSVIRKAFPPQVHITGTVGELTKNKNQIALLEDAKRDTNLFVAIVGEGEDRAMLERKIKEYGLQDRVKLFGFLPAADVLKGFDTFALPSLKEGLPYVLLEAKAAGLPIEANPVGGIPEIMNGKIEDFTLDRMVKETAALY
jgi:glycosyltransferase involved in cell wall biosynthesis